MSMVGNPPARQHRVLLVAPRFHTNQVPVVHALREAGHEVAFFSLRQGYTEWHEILQPTVFGRSWLTKLAYFVLRPKDRYRFDLRYALPELGRFVKEFRAFRPTIVVIRSPESAFGLVTLFASLVSKSKPILYIQGSKYLRGRRRLFSQWISQAPIITPVLGEISEDTYPQPNTYYVPFVMPTRTRPDEKDWCPDGIVRIMSVGKFYSRKRQDLLISSLLKVGINFRLTIVGECRGEVQENNLKKIKQYIKSVGFDTKVSILTNLNYLDVQSLYAQHDLYVLPSSNEPAAVSHLEAMAHSLPIICSDTCGTRCYIVEGYNGAIFKSENADDLAEKIVQIAGAPERLVMMGKRSYALVQHRHRPALYVQAIENLAQGLPVDESVFLSLPEE